jgi:hypothetical protein
VVDNLVLEETFLQVFHTPLPVISPVSHISSSGAGIIRPSENKMLMAVTPSCPCVTKQSVLTSHYVLPHNLDVVFAVWTCVLMPEANHMTQLMHHNAKLVTILPNRYSLWTIATLPNKGTAPAA